jgi:hypothetical protein
MAFNRRPYGQRARSSHGGADEEMAELEAMLARDADDGPGAAWRSRIVGWGADKPRRARGRELLAEGAVRSLRVEPGRIVAEVVGTQVYQVQVVVRPPSRWEIESMRRELQTPAILRHPGALSNDALLMLDALVRTMVVTCTCMDGWGCKHAVAALLAFAPRLDAEPAALLTLWGVAGAPGAAEAMAEPRFTLLPLAAGKEALTGDLGELFGIDLVTPTEK